MPLNDHLTTLFSRELDRVAEELEQYERESDLWKVSGEVRNSAGNLALHLAGNLNHFIGHVLGGTDYQRQREAEFTAKDVPRSELIAMLEETKKVIASVLPKLSEADLALTYPQPVMGHTWTTEFMLLHLLAHLSYHLGQVNYHRRLVGR